MVLLMDEINAPLRWPLARITKIYPARDGLVRVVEIKAKGKTYKRPIGKLALLPIEKDITRQSQITFENEGNEPATVHTESKSPQNKMNYIRNPNFSEPLSIKFILVHYIRKYVYTITRANFHQFQIC